MAGWYRVVETIKGHQYLYEQQTYREGGRVRTRNRYIGRAGEGGKTATPLGHLSLPTSAPFTDPSDFGRALASQFDAPAWGRDAQQQVLGGKTPKQGRKRRPQAIETGQANIRKRVSVHILRHTFGAHKADKHMSIATLQTLMGHKRKETTLKYIHLARTNLRKEMVDTAL